jgi:predicted  nucleic acid-binding Zn-ribbon protein
MIIANISLDNVFQARDTAKDLTREKSVLQDELVSVSHQLEKYREEEKRLKTENDRLEVNLKSVSDELTEQTKELSVAQNLASDANLKCEELSSRLTVTCLFLPPQGHERNFFVLI